MAFLKLLQEASDRFPELRALSGSESGVVLEHSAELWFTGLYYSISTPYHLGSFWQKAVGQCA